MSDFTVFLAGRRLAVRRIASTVLVFGGSPLAVGRFLTFRVVAISYCGVCVFLLVHRDSHGSRSVAPCEYSAFLWDCELNSASVWWHTLAGILLLCGCIICNSSISYDDADRFVTTELFDRVNKVWAVLIEFHHVLRGGGSPGVFNYFIAR